jgi:hypothetical protein
MASFTPTKQGIINYHLNVDAIAYVETLPNGSTMVHFIGRDKGLHIETPAAQIVERARNLS